MCLQKTYNALEQNDVGVVSFQDMLFQASVCEFLMSVALQKLALPGSSWGSSL